MTNEQLLALLRRMNERIGLIERTLESRGISVAEQADDESDARGREADERQPY